MERDKKKPRVLMIGPGRNVRGGISTVVNTYYSVGLDQRVTLKYIATMEDGSKFKKFLIAIRAYLSFCRVVKDYDIVHVHMAAQASFSRKALFIKKAYKTGKRIIIHQHAADFDDFFFKQSSNKKKKKIKTIFSKADKVVVLSEEWAHFFMQNICNRDKVIILYNGVFLPKYRKEEYSDHKVLFLGKLGKRKGSYDLLEAIPEILKQVPDATFYFGGDGDIEQSKKISKTKNIEHHIQFLGWIGEEEKQQYLKEISVFVLPSYHEGMPMAVLEAMSYGMATVSTDVGGIPQIIEDGVNGILIGAGDIKALTETLVSLLCDAEKKRRLGQTAYLTINEKFNIEKEIEKVYQLYV